MAKPINCDHITDEYIEQAFEGTNFGPVNKRKMLEQGCLKAACDSWSGHTLSTIMVEIGFTKKLHGKLTKLGKRFLMDALYQPKQSG
ncbi:hypothetical protein ACUNG1_25780 [Serratia sp. IR-2025]